MEANSPGNGDKLDTKDFPVTLGTAAYRPRNPWVEGEESETIWRLPRLAQPGANSIPPPRNPPSVYSTLWEEERKVTLLCWVAKASSFWSFCCQLRCLHPGSSPRRDGVPGKGLIPVGSCRAQCAGESCRLQITVPGGCSRAACC